MIFSVEIKCATEKLTHKNSLKFPAFFLAFAYSFTFTAVDRHGGLIPEIIKIFLLGERLRDISDLGTFPTQNFLTPTFPLEMHSV